MDNKEKFKLKLYNTVLDRTEVDDLLLCLQTCLKEKDCVFEYKIYRWDQWSKMIEILFDQFPIEFIRLLSVSASLAGKLYKDFYFIASNSDFAVTNNPKKRYFVPDNDKSFPNIEEAIQSLPSDDASDYPVQIMHCLDLGNLHNAFELEASEIWSPYSDCKDFTHLVYGSYNKKERFQKLIKVRQSLIRELSKELLTSIAEENLDKTGIFSDASGKPALLNLSQIVSIIPDDNDSEKPTADISFSNGKEIKVDLQVFLKEITGITNEKTLKLPVSLIPSSDAKLKINASLGYDFYMDVWQRYKQMKESQKTHLEEQISHADCAEDEADDDDDDTFDMSEYKVNSD